MSFWLLIATTLTLQEGISTIAVLLKAEQLHYSLWIIHLIWLAVTIIQIVVGYRLGKRLQKTFANSKFELWIQKSTKKLEASIDSRGEKLALFVLALVISPFVATFLASWLDISFSSIFLFTFLGDAFWYASEWATVLGVQELFSQAKDVAVIVVLLVIFGIVAFRMFGKRKLG